MRTLNLINPKEIITEKDATISQQEAAILELTKTAKEAESLKWLRWARNRVKWRRKWKCLGARSRARVE